MIITKNKNVRQLVCQLQYVETAVEGYELYYYNTEDDIYPVVSQAFCEIDVTRLEQRVYSVLWTLWRITLKAYNYEYGICLKFACTCHNLL